MPRKKTATDTPDPPRGRKRLPPNERELLIVEGAVSYFAEVGFQGQVRELASRLGITNALLFRYFPTKEDLIDRVYQQVYLSRWRPEWNELLRDRRQPLEQRLRRFYRSYLAAIFTYDWVRIFFFAGLRGVNINERYLQLLETQVVRVICEEVREAAGLPSPAEVPVSDAERHAVWGLQGQVFYIGVRRFIYNQEIDDPEAIVDVAVEFFMAGVGALAARATADHAEAAPAREPVRRKRAA